MTGAAHRGGLVVILFRLDLLLLLRRLMRLLRWLWWWLAVALLSLGHAALESRRTLQIFGSPLDQSLPRARNGFLREAQATLSFRAQALNFFHSVMRPAPGKIAASEETRRTGKSSGATRVAPPDQFSIHENNTGAAGAALAARADPIAVAATGRRRRRRTRAACAPSSARAAERAP